MSSIFTLQWDNLVLSYCYISYITFISTGKCDPALKINYYGLLYKCVIIGMDFAENRIISYCLNVWECLAIINILISILKLVFETGIRSFQNYIVYNLILLNGLIGIAGKYFIFVDYCLYVEYWHSFCGKEDQINVECLVILYYNLVFINNMTWKMWITRQYCG